MKKSKILAAAMASAALTGMLGACSFSPEENVEPDVYGPPESYEEPAEESADESSEEPELWVTIGSASTVSLYSPDSALHTTTDSP